MSSKYLQTSDPSLTTQNDVFKFNTSDGGTQSHQEGIDGDRPFPFFRYDGKQRTRFASEPHEVPQLDSSRLSDKPLSIRTGSTGLDSGMGSSRQQSQTISRTTSTSTTECTTVLPSKKFEFELSRVSDRTESVESFSRNSCKGVRDSGGFCDDIMSKSWCLNVSRKNVESIASEVLLHDILHSTGK